MHVHYSLSLNLFHIHPSTNQVLLGLPPKYNLNLSPFPSPWPSHRSKSPSSIARTAVKTSPDCFPTSVHITPANRCHVTNSSKSSSSSQDHNAPSCPSVSPHLIPPFPLPTMLQPQWPLCTTPGVHSLSLLPRDLQVSAELEHSHP